MRVSVERLNSIFGQSFKVQKFENLSFSDETMWHCHSDYELIYLSNGSGKRHINNHISYYDQGDLVFIGPNLPHWGFTVEQQKNCTKVSVQLSPDFLGNEFLQAPELHHITKLFDRAKSALSFSGKTKHRVGEMLIGMIDDQPFQRLIKFLHILNDLALSDETVALHADSYTYTLALEDQDRIEVVLQYVKNNFSGEVSLTEIADLINMSVPGFCRYFKKVTGQTFINFVNEFRIDFATQLLRKENMLITDIAHDAGFNNISHFNRQFLKITGLSPREYKIAQQPIIQLKKESQ